MVLLQEIYYRLESALGAATVPGLAPGSSDIFSAAAVLSQGAMLFRGWYACTAFSVTTAACEVSSREGNLQLQERRWVKMKTRQARTQM